MSAAKNAKALVQRPTTLVAVEEIKPHPHNPRTHSKKQIRQIADSIQAVGFAEPVLIDEGGVLLAGHGRPEAAKLLGLNGIPAVVIEGLSEARKRALLLADNRIPQSAGWDRERLADELISLPELLVEDGLDISVTGFEPAEIDALLADFEDDVSDPADDIDPAFLSAPAVTHQGDLWQLGKHRLLCGDARETQHLARLMGGERAQMAFLDPPYNLRVRGIVGRGHIKHQEFAMASGEMAAPAFYALSDRHPHGGSARLDRWRGAFCLHGLASCRRTGGSRPGRVWHHAQPDRLGEIQCRSGQLLSQPA